MQAEDKIRINRYLAMGGICSRRDADKLIEQGQVTINGKVALNGDKVGQNDVVQVGKKRIEPEKRRVVLAFYKPVGVVCTERDPHAEKMIMDMIRYPIRVTYAGRLDKDSEGLLLLTNEGQLIQAMMRGANGHEKEYIVKTDKEITDDFIYNMEQGVYLKDLDIKTKPCKLKKIGKYTFSIILTQGVNKQIRRMCQTFGYQVTELKRIRVLNITLDGLKKGEYRELNDEEINQLYKMCNLTDSGE